MQNEYLYYAKDNYFSLPLQTSRIGGCLLGFCGGSGIYLLCRSCYKLWSCTAEDTPPPIKDWLNHFLYFVIQCFFWVSVKTDCCSLCSMERIYVVLRTAFSDFPFNPNRNGISLCTDCGLYGVAVIEFSLGRGVGAHCRMCGSRWVQDIPDYVREKVNETYY